ncbi:MAG: LpqB family beta-propeller domain-containing protein [Micrococcales bacterium]|nr:LpqB family beta-propeller domain-containing protein [Micrococcales bacterium]
MAGLVLLAGCAIPSSGPVRPGDWHADEVLGAVTVAQGPQPGASARSVVEGFLTAGAAGLTGDFEVARQFLDPADARSWQPLAAATVTRSTTLEQTADDQVVAMLAVVGQVDADGRFTERSGIGQAVTFDLVEVEGEWRITDPPPGLIVSDRVFGQQYRRAPVYFLTPDRTQLVPDVRYFPVHDLATSVVSELLDGPSPWLRGAVVSALPDGVSLRSETVRVDGGVAQVVLEPARTVGSAGERDLMLTQITSSLSLGHIRSVQVRAGQDGALLTGEDVLAALPAGLPVMLSGDALVQQSADLVPVDGVGTLAGLRAGAPAVSEDQTLRVALSGTDRLVALPTDSTAARTLLAGPGLVRPSVDRHRWAWTATSAKGAGLHAVTVEGEVVDVSARWLADRTVQALRVSREGARVAVASSGPDGLVIEVCGVVRDAQGRPSSLTDPVRVGPGVLVADQIVWTDPETLVVLGRVGGVTTLTRVPVSGISEVLTPVPDAVAVAADRSGSTLMVATVSGSLLRHYGSTWVEIGPSDQPMRDPTYPG